MTKADNPNTLCWECANAANPFKCPWADRFETVPGWKAVPTQIKFAKRGYTELSESYRVEDCPLFERDSIKGGQVKFKEVAD